MYIQHGCYYAGHYRAFEYGNSNENSGPASEEEESVLAVRNR